MMLDLIELALRPIPKVPAVIFDIDGTLMSALHRTHFVETELKADQNWTAFHENMVRDATIPEVLDTLMQHKNAGDQIVLLSLRPERFRPIIAADFKKRGIPYDKLLLRPDGSSGNGPEKKREIYRREIKPFYDVKMAYDDWQEVNDMWTSEGVPNTTVVDPNLPPLDVPLARDPRRITNGHTTGGGEKGSLESLLQKWQHPSSGIITVPPYMREKGGQIENVEGYTYRRGKMFPVSAVARLKTKVARGKG